jgi:hypothetical protein
MWRPDDPVQGKDTGMGICGQPGFSMDKTQWMDYCVCFIDYRDCQTGVSDRMQRERIEFVFRMNLRPVEWFV